MDEIVRRAMAKWPDVPAVFGWLALDRRGRWLIRNERIGNPLMAEYIGRNYTHDDHGRWFFQNGPQRVFVSLSYTPWVLRLGHTGALTTHTQRPVHDVRSAWIDERGIVLLDTEYGLAMVDDRDVEALAQGFTDSVGNGVDDDRLLVSLEKMQAGGEAGLMLPHASGALPLNPIVGAEVPDRFGFVADPQPLADTAVGT
jgi:hypothetical protein